MLTRIGEHRVLSTTTNPTPTAIKCLDAVSTALLEVCTVHDWSWLYRRFTPPAVNWTTEKVDMVSPGVSNIQRVHAVRVSQTDAPEREVLFVDASSFYGLRRLAPWSSDRDYSQVYTLIDERTLAFNRYPSNDTQRAKFNIYATIYPIMPAADGDVFEEFPDQYLPMLYSKASYHMAVNHLNDLNLASYHQSQFETQAGQTRARERQLPTSSQNVFRNHGRRFIP